MRALFDKKPIIALTEPEISKGGLTRQQLTLQLQDAVDTFDSWRLTDEMVEWGFPPPSAHDLLKALFANGPPIEWNRLGLFQVTAICPLLHDAHPPSVPHLRTTYPALDSLSSCSAVVCSEREHPPPLWVCGSCLPRRK
jgi:hypothetical protein